MIPKITRQKATVLEGIFRAFEGKPIRIPARRHCAIVENDGAPRGVFYSRRNGFPSQYTRKVEFIGRYEGNVFYMEPMHPMKPSLE